MQPRTTEPVRRCIVPISTELLEEFFLPPGSKIVSVKAGERVRSDGSPEALELVVENETLPHVERGELLPRIAVMVTEERRRVYFDIVANRLPSTHTD